MRTCIAGRCARTSSHFNLCCSRKCLCAVFGRGLQIHCLQTAHEEATCLWSMVNSEWLSIFSPNMGEGRDSIFGRKYSILEALYSFLRRKYLFEIFERIVLTLEWKKLVAFRIICTVLQFDLQMEYRYSRNLDNSLICGAQFANGRGSSILVSCYDKHELAMYKIMKKSTSNQSKDNANATANANNGTNA